jgi:signal recognition particle subunit SRP54
MLNNLTQRLSKVVKTMRGEARLTESNTAEMLREVRVALLEADVALPAVREFIGRVKEKALGEAVIGSLTPGQALVGVVHDELAKLMGSDIGIEARQLSFATQPPAIILMAGLQGAGKTTTIRMLVGLIRPSAGTIQVCGYDLRTQFTKAIRHLGCIVENPELYGFLSG